MALLMLQMASYPCWNYLENLGLLNKIYGCNLWNTVTSTNYLISSLFENSTMISIQANGHEVLLGFPINHQDLNRVSSHLFYICFRIVGSFIYVEEGVKSRLEGLKELVPMLKIVERRQALLVPLF